MKEAEKKDVLIKKKMKKKMKKLKDGHDRKMGIT